jgi:hypothetical protein
VFRYSDGYHLYRLNFNRKFRLYGWVTVYGHEKHFLFIKSFGFNFLSKKLDFDLTFFFFSKYQKIFSQLKPGIPPHVTHQNSILLIFSAPLTFIQSQCSISWLELSEVKRFELFFLYRFNPFPLPRNINFDRFYLALIQIINLISPIKLNNSRF